MYSKYFITLILLLWMQFIYGHAFMGTDYQKYQEVVEKTVNFSIEDPYIYVSNRYGNIDIKTAVGTTASLKATIVVETKNRERADKIIDRIDIDIWSSENSLKALTSIDNNDGWNLTKQDESYAIHYTLSIPKSSNLSVENKYGNISIAALDNDLSIELKHGEGQVQDVNGDIELELEHVDQFSLGNVTGDALLEISHSKYRMQDVNKVDLEAKHAKINIRDATKINAETKNTELTINSIKAFYNEGKYDEINITDIGALNIETKYTHVTLGTLHEIGLFYTEHGKVSIDEVSSGFEEIEIEGKYTDYQMNVDGGYTIDIRGKYLSASYPDDINIIDREKDKSNLRIKGTKPGSGNGKITATLKNGKIRLRD